MPLPNQPITASFLSAIPFRIVETKTGNQVFSATVVQTATASAYTYPKALSIAVELATESSLKQGRKLISEYLANKSNKVEQLNARTSPIRSLPCPTSCDKYSSCVQYNAYYGDDGNLDFIYDECYYTFNKCGIVYTECACCSNQNSSSELTSCNDTLTTNLCANSPCGCPSSNCAC
jgi:hypothetical protein